MLEKRFGKAINLAGKRRRNPEQPITGEMREKERVMSAKPHSWHSRCGRNYRALPLTPLTATSSTSTTKNLEVG
jgi:hypothetical protein